MKRIKKAFLSFVVLTAMTVTARPDVLMGNLSTYNNDSGPTTSFFTGGKEVGFKTGPNPYSLLDVVLRLKVGSSANPPLVSLYSGGSTSGTPTAPTTLVTTFANPPSFSYGTTTDYTFTLASPALLQPNTTYWIVLQAGGNFSTTIGWTSGSPLVTFTGSDLTSSGTLYNISTNTSPTTWTAASSTWNWLQVDGSSFGQTYDTSWLANSSGTPGITQDIDDIFVTTNGTVYTNTRWYENGHEIEMIQNGVIQNPLTNWATHGGGNEGGLAIAANSTYVFASQGMRGLATSETNSNGKANNPLTGSEWALIRRYTLNGGQSAFSTGYGFYGNMLVLDAVGEQSGGGISEVSGGATTEVTGLVATNSALYISIGPIQPTPPNPQQTLPPSIQEYNPSTMAFVRSWNMNRPGKMAIDSSGNLWIIQNGDATHAPQIVEYSSTGTLMSGAITFAGGVLPGSIAWNAVASRLMVGDYGPDQNVKMYNISSLSGSPTIVASTFGTVNGIYSGTRGAVGTLKFNAPTGVGSDSSGNIYVAHNGQGPTISPQVTPWNAALDYDVGSGATLESYTAAGTQNWVVNGLTFVDCADVDPASETDVYTGDKHFVMNYSNPPGKQWTYAGYTLDRVNYPQDPRLNSNNTGRTGATWIRYIHGSKFMFSTDMYGTMLAIYRFAGNIAIPSGFWSRGNTATPTSPWPPNQPASGEWIWRDTNGNGAFDAGEFNQKSPVGSANEMGGRWVDSTGNIWMGQDSIFREIPVGATLDAYGNPQYSFSTMQTLTFPTSLNRVERIQYDDADDVMYVAGWSSTDTAESGIFKRIARVSNWSTGNRVPDWTIVPPDYNYTGNNATNVLPKSMSIAGDYLFVGYFAPVNKHVTIYNLSDGSYYGTLYPGSAVGNYAGDVDTLQGINAYQRSNGTYLVFQEDDTLAKVLMYQWSPGGGFSIANGTYSFVDQYYPGVSLTAPAGSGANIILATSSGASTQKWTIANLGNGYCSIINQSTGMAMEASSTTTNVVQNPYSATNLYQQWQVNNLVGTVNPPTPYYALVNRGSGNGLQAGSISTTNQATLAITHQTMQWLITIAP